MWTYKGVAIDFDAKRTHNGTEHFMPMQDREGWQHALLKVVTAAHLLEWGYLWERIHFEQSPPAAPSRLRADVYAEGRGELPSFWFECRNVANEKLETLGEGMPDWRIVNIMYVTSFLDWWAAKRILPSVDRRNLSDQESRLVSQSIRGLVRAYQVQQTVPGVEYRAARIETNLPDLIYAVRREKSGTLTYLDTGEGWSLGNEFFHSRKEDAFDALIPGRVGSSSWRGESRRGRPSDDGL